MVDLKRLLTKWAGGERALQQQIEGAVEEGDDDAAS